MAVVHQGTCQILIQETGETVDVSAEAIDFEAVGGDEGGMGTEIMYEAEIDIESERTGKRFPFKWTVTEYPVGVLDYRDAKGDGLKLIKDFEIRVQSD